MSRVRNAGEMATALKRFADIIEADFATIVVAGSFDLHNQLMILTPKDTGWASQHWSISLTTNESEASTIDALSDFKIGDTVHIFSNVPYIQRLDEGWSKQRPSGFTHLGMSYIFNKFNDMTKSYERRRYV